MKDKDTLDDALDFVSKEARHMVIDSVYCHFANEAGTLEGNTEESDVEWYANWLYQNDDYSRRTHWDYLEEDERERYRHMARLGLKSLPFLVSRIANRYRSIANAMQLIERQNREELYTRKR